MLVLAYLQEKTLISHPPYAGTLADLQPYTFNFAESLHILQRWHAESEVYSVQIREFILERKLRVAIMKKD